jgi:hypothetical protein
MGGLATGLPARSTVVAIVDEAVGVRVRQTELRAAGEGAACLGLRGQSRLLPGHGPSRVISRNQL